MTALDTGTPDLLARVEDGVAVLTLNRPERRNALSTDMIAALEHQLAVLEVDESVGAIVLTGAGGAFCAGGDVKGFAERTPGAPPAAQERRQRASQRGTSARIWHMSTPTVAVLPGPAAGAGLSLALACDLRYAADRAFLTTAFARVGLAGDYGGTWFLTRLVGPAKARELYLLSERVGAEEALRLGLVNGVVTADELEAHVLERARRLAAGPRVALALMKENLNRALHAPLEELLDLEATHHLRTGLTEDHAKAARAFVEKRDPAFKGR